MSRKHLALATCHCFVPLLALDNNKIIFYGKWQQVLQSDIVSSPTAFHHNFHSTVLPSFSPSPTALSGIPKIVFAPLSTRIEAVQSNYRGPPSLCKPSDLMTSTLLAVVQGAGMPSFFIDLTWYSKRKSISEKYNAPWSLSTPLFLMAITHK